MKQIGRWTVVSLLGMIISTTGWAEEEVMEFFQQEAKVVSASHEPQPANQAPATVYVVTQDDIRASGAKTFYDALRGVPGVDVLQTSTFDGQVTIHGFAATYGNDTLVLLDGRTVLSGYLNTIVWETLPVSLDEVDRIEIVEGPASAVYGTGAIMGVINIITKTPEQLKGGRAYYTYGDYSTQLSDFVYGNKHDKFGYKIGGGWRATNRFSDTSRPASEAGQVNTVLSYDLSDISTVKLSAGYNHHETATTLGSAGRAIDLGITTFARLDYNCGDTRFRTFWNHDESQPKGFAFLQDSNLIDNTIDSSIEHSFREFLGQKTLLGASYRKNTARSQIFSGTSIEQDLWAIYGEDKWQIAPQWSLMGSARLDRHPFAPLTFSPRGTLLFTPESHHVFRASAGTAFRNPNLVENYLFLSSVQPNPDPSSNPPFTDIQTTIAGSRDVQPERLVSEDLNYTGDFGRLRTSVDAFHYDLKSFITNSPTQVDATIPPTIFLLSTYANIYHFTAWGYQIGEEFIMNSWLRLFGNYTYQYLHDEVGAQMQSQQAPRHKANLGFRTKHEGFTSYLAAHWVDKTKWPAILVASSESDLAPVSAYWLLNATVGYAFRGRLKGLEASLSVFNLLNHDHFELLPDQGLVGPGQNGEIIRSRIAGTLSFSF